MAYVQHLHTFTKYQHGPYAAETRSAARHAGGEKEAMVRVSAARHAGGEKEAMVRVVLGVGVSAATSLLRLFTKNRDRRNELTNDSSTGGRNIIQVQDVMDALKFDYDQSYFLTGNFTRSLYTEDCYFADPTISFSGRDLYERNLKLLVPFLEEPSLTLVSLDEDVGEVHSIRAVWKLRTHLKLPWRPFIQIDGSTSYTMDKQLRISRHVEFWSTPILEAFSQLIKKGEVPS